MPKEISASRIGASGVSATGVSATGILKKQTIRIVPRKELIANKPTELFFGQNQKYQFLYQLSDVHIPPIRRHAEYRVVFDQVYRQLKASEPGLIVLTGDIVDAKIKVTNELLILLFEFLNNLAEIMPVILIPGNHDLNIREKDRIDTLLGALLSPGNGNGNGHGNETGPVESKPVAEILAEIEKKGYLYGRYCRIPNLVYLRKSGGYRIGNLIFGLSSFLDDQVYPAKSILRPSGVGEVDYLIGLAHLSLYEAVYSTGIRHLSRKYTLETFRGYDFVLLGDIHQPQFMNQEHTVGYPGSLLQINFGEPLGGHGYLKWDLKAGRGEMQVVRNPRGFMKIRFEAGQLLNKAQVLADLAMVDEVRLRIYHDLKTERTVIDKFLNSELTVKVLESKRIADRISVNNNDGGLVNLGEGKVEFENLYQLATQLNYLKAYLEKQAVGVELIAKILDIHREFYKSAHSENRSEESESLSVNSVDGKSTESLNSGKSTTDSLNSGEDSKTSETVDFEWRIRCLKFKNIFCYRGNNQINFQGLRGLIGILGNNSLGKSTIMDIILFAIFNKCDRVDLTNREDLLTKGENSGWIELTIDEGGTKNSGSVGSAESGVGSAENSGSAESGVGSAENSGSAGGVGSAEGAENSGSAEGAESGAGSANSSELILFLEIKRQVNGSVRINRSYFRRKESGLIQIGGNSEAGRMAKLFGDYQTFVMVHVKLQSNIGEMGSAGARDQHNILHKLLKLDCFKNMCVTASQELTDLRKKLRTLERTMVGKESFEKLNLTLTEKKAEFATLEHRRQTLEQDFKKDQLVIEGLYQTRQKLVLPVLKDDGLKEKVLRLTAKIEILESQLSKFDRKSLENLVANFEVDKFEEFDKFEEASAKKVLVESAEDSESDDDLTTDDQILKLANFQQTIKNKISALEQIDPMVETRSAFNQILALGLPAFELKHLLVKLNFDSMVEHLTVTDEAIGEIQKSYLLQLKVSNDLEKRLQKTQWDLDNYGFLNNLKYHSDCLDCQSNQKIIQVGLNDLNHEDSFESKNKLEHDLIRAQTAMGDLKLRLGELQLTKINYLKTLIDPLESFYQQARILRNQENLRTTQENLRREDTKRKQIEHESRLQTLEKFLECDRWYEELKPLEANLKLAEAELKDQINDYQQNLKDHDKKLEIAKSCLEARVEEFQEVDQIYQTDKLTLFWLEKQLVEAQVNATELIRLENRINCLKIYAEAISEKGILKQVVEDKLELMSDLINNIIQSMDPEIKIEIDYNEQGFQLLLIKHEHRFNYKILGGFEKFLVNLALKIALSTVSNVSKPNFVCIDEGWGTADFNHRNNLDLFLENLSQRYEMILIVSHIPELVDLLEGNRLPIYERAEGGSGINNSELTDSEISPVVPVVAFSGRDRSMDRPKSQKKTPRKTVEIKMV